jgi:aspartyl protease family protein
MTRTIGKRMIFLAWVLALGLLTFLFGGLLERDANPNLSPETLSDGAGGKRVVLKRNRAGHYVAGGRINGHPVVFLLDTGASDVAVPLAVAERIGLEPGFRTRARTAAGDVDTWSTVLRSVQLGEIRLHTVRASILPEMQGEQVLLGMSFLKRLELIQRGDTLTVRLPGG